jgi:hypothetical protein
MCYIDGQKNKYSMVGKPEGNIPLGRPRPGPMNIIEMYLREDGVYGLD